MVAGAGVAVLAAGAVAGAAGTFTRATKRRCSLAKMLAMASKSVMASPARYLENGWHTMSISVGVAMVGNPYQAVWVVEGFESGSVALMLLTPNRTAGAVATCMVAYSTL